MEVRADLTLEVDGVVSTLTGSGRDLVLHSADPAGILEALSYAALPASVGRIDGPRALGRVADALQEQGLRIDLTGPDGVYLRLGRGAQSRLGEVVTRSSFVQPGTVSAVRPLVGAELGRRLKRPAGVAAVSASVIAALMVVWRLVRRATGS
ncbi:hypothetical protein acdb102_07180 [Acidothermaceae bacterium B102]|nr:hypothetical protein acdb102_07180 [Acidothermaceae bacterium B102]